MMCPQDRKAPLRREGTPARLGEVRWEKEQGNFGITVPDRVRRVGLHLLVAVLGSMGHETVPPRANRHTTETATQGSPHRSLRGVFLHPKPLQMHPDRQLVRSVTVGTGRLTRPAGGPGSPCQRESKPGTTLECIDRAMSTGLPWTVPDADNNGQTTDNGGFSEPTAKHKKIQAAMLVLVVGWPHQMPSRVRENTKIGYPNNGSIFLVRVAKSQEEKKKRTRRTRKGTKGRSYRYSLLTWAVCPLHDIVHTRSERPRCFPLRTPRWPCPSRPRHREPHTLGPTKPSRGNPGVQVPPCPGAISGPLPHPQQICSLLLVHPPRRYLVPPKSGRWTRSWTNCFVPTVRNQTLLFAVNVMSRPGINQMEAKLKKIQAAKRLREERREREECAEADLQEGAAFGRGQTMRQERLKAAATAENQRRKQELKEQEQLAEQEEQKDIQAALELADATEEVRIDKTQRKAADKLLAGTAFHKLVSYDLLKSLLVLAARWPSNCTPEVVPPLGSKIQVAVLRIELDATAAGLYRAFAGQLAPGSQFRDGVVDMPLVRLKKDGSQPTEGKTAIIFAEVTPELSEFLRTGTGWEMGLPNLQDRSQMEPATAHILRERELWVKLAKDDQIDLFFNMCRILGVPFREAVWQACRCLTACYEMAGHKVRFTTIEFSTTGRRTGNKPPPAVDPYDPEVQRFAVCASAEERQLVEVTSVTKAVWFDEATEIGLRQSIFAVPVHFDSSSQKLGRRADPLTQAVEDALAALHTTSPPGLRTSEEEDAVIQVTAKLPPGKTHQYLLEHHNGTRLALVVAHNFQSHLQGQGVDPVGVGVSTLTGQVRLDIGVVVAVTGSGAAQVLIKRSREGSLQVLQGIDSKLLQFKLLSKASTKTNDDDGWETVGRTSKVHRERISRLVAATGQRPAALRALAVLIREAVVQAPLTLPGLDGKGMPIQAGEATSPIEDWAALRAEDVNDIRVRLPLLPPGKATPLLLQILEESREVRIDYDPGVSQYIVTLPADEEMREAGADHATDTGSASDTDPLDSTVAGAAREETETSRDPPDA